MTRTLTVAAAALTLTVCAPQPTYRFVTEQADGSSQIADYGLSRSDCDALADEWLAVPWSAGEPVIIYCERY